MATTIYSKTMTKTMAFQSLRALAEEAGQDDLVAVCDYELDKIATAAEKAKEKRGGAASTSAGRLCSAYAVELSKAILEVLDATPKTQEQVVAALAGKTVNGKEVKNSPWVASVLNALAGTGKPISDEEAKAINPDGVTVKVTMAKAQKTDSHGLIKEVLIKAFARA